MTEDRTATPADSGPTVAGYVSGLLLAALRSPGRDPERAERVAGGLVALLVAEGAARYVRPFLEAEPGRPATFEVRPVLAAEQQTAFFPEGTTRATSDLGDALRQALAIVEAGTGGALVIAVDAGGLLRRRALECLKDGAVRLILPSEEAFEGESGLCSEAARCWRDFLARGPAPADPVRLAGATLASPVPAGPRPGDVVRFAAPATAFRAAPAMDSQDGAEPGSALSSAAAVEALAPSPGAGPVAPSQVMVEALADAVRAALADLTVEVDLENMEAALGQMVKQVVAESVGEVAREAATAAAQAAAEATPAAPGPSAEEISGRLTELLATEVAARVVVGLPAPPLVPSAGEVAAEVAARVVAGLPDPPVVPSVGEVAAEVAARVVADLPTPPAPGPSAEELAGRLTELLATEVAARVVVGLPDPPVVPSAGEVAADVAARVVADLPDPPAVPSVGEIAAEVAARVVADLPTPPVPGPSAEELAGRLTELLATEVAARVVVGLPDPPVVPSAGEVAAEVAARVVADLPDPPAVPSVGEVAAEVAARVLGDLPAPPVPGPSAEELAGRLTELLATEVAARVVVGLPDPPAVPSAGEVAAEVAARVVADLPAPPLAPPPVPTAGEIAGSVRSLMPSAESLAEQVLVQLWPLLTDRLTKLQEAALTTDPSGYTSLAAAVNQLGTQLDASFERIGSSALETLSQELSARESALQTLAQELWAKESATVSFVDFSQRIEASIDRVLDRVDDLERRLAEARRQRPLRARPEVPEEQPGSVPPVRVRPLRARPTVPEEQAGSVPPVRRRPLRARPEVPEEQPVAVPPARRRAKKPES